SEVGEAVEQLHHVFARLKHALKPVVTAVQGRALGGGCELVLHSPIVVAASESYIGLVETGVGLLPAGGGLAELTDRIMRTNHKKENKQAPITNILMQICLVKVATNSYEAKRYDYLKETDTVILNTERRI